MTDNPKAWAGMHRVLVEMTPDEARRYASLADPAHFDRLNRLADIADGLVIPKDTLTGWPPLSAEGPPRVTGPGGGGRTPTDQTNRPSPRGRPDNPEPQQSPSAWSKAAAATHPPNKPDVGKRTNPHRGRDNP